jgi:phage major head subunit gpT-like protein
MSVNVQVAINRIFQEFNTSLLQSFNDSPRVHPAYALEVPSSSRSTLHAWLGDQATVQEWFGKRKARSMGTRNWEIVNRNWELTYSFEANQIADDLSGLVAAAVMKARSNGVKWARHEDSLCASVLEAGPTSLCYDGQDFFSGFHPVDIEGITSGTFSNLNTSSPLTHANFNTAMVQMHNYKLEDGSPMVPPGTSLVLMVPPALRLKAMQIVTIPVLTAAATYGLYGTSGPSDNPFVGAAQIVENAYLTSDTTWYLIANDAGMKPILMQRRQGVETNELGPGSQLYFEEKKIQIGGDARYSCSYSFPQLAIQNTA